MPLSIRRHVALRQAAVAVALLPAMALVVGCHLIESETPITEQSLLKAAQSSSDAVTLDIYWLRLPGGQAAEGAVEQEAQLWDQLQEDRLPVDLRRRLASNGLRAGVVGAATPVELLRLIDPYGTGDTSTAGSSELRETGVRRRTRQLRPGGTLELAASDILDEAPVLVSRDGRVSGKTYRRVQGMYLLGVGRQQSDRVRVTLSPEVRHGEQQLRFVSDETGAMSRGALQRETDAFPELAIEAPIAPGEMLLVTNLPGSGARLGGLFHAASGPRKAILVRVASAPASRAFLPDSGLSSASASADE
ncbi:MAG: hypothetical protein AAGB00_10800 [Planctomycetota bacterium]